MIVTQLVECRPSKSNVVGSNPIYHSSVQKDNGESYVYLMYTVLHKSRIMQLGVRVRQRCKSEAELICVSTRSLKDKVMAATG